MTKTAATPDDEPEKKPEIIVPSAVETISRVEIDTQIATAKKYPRNLATFIKNAKTMVSSSTAVARSCVYTRPVGRDKNGQQQYASGGSIRFAEILFSEYGNLHIAGRIAEIGEREVTTQAVAYDLEKNSRLAVENSRSIMTSPKRGDPKRFPDHLIQVTAAASISIALRNAILRIIPRAKWEPIYALACKTLKGTGDPRKRIEGAVKWFVDQGMTEQEVCEIVRRPSVADISEDDFIILVGLSNSVQEGTLSVSDLRKEAIPLRDENKPDMFQKAAEEMAESSTFVDLCEGMRQAAEDGKLKEFYDELTTETKKKLQAGEMGKLVQLYNELSS